MSRTIDSARSPASSETSDTSPIRSAVVCVEALAGDEVAPRGRADLREDERRDHSRDDPEPDLREAEHRIGPRDRDVGAGDETRAAAEREAVHAADHGSRAGVDRLEHPVEAHRVGDVLLVGQVDRRALPLDVRAGAERRPVAFEQHGSRIADVREGLRELGDERRVECIAPLGLRERHAEEVPVPLDPQRRHLRGA